MSQHDSSVTTSQDQQQTSSVDITRRQFFVTGGAATAGVLAMTMPSEARGEKPAGETARAVRADQPLPSFLELVTNQGKPASKSEVAEKSIIKLDSAMNELYAATLTFSKHNFRDQFPIIVALFSGQGGQMILYPPGKPPLVADRVPVAYELAKSVSHTPMAVYQIVVPYLKDATADSSWKGPMRTFRTQNQTALDNLASVDLSPEDKDALAGILKRNIGFMDRCLEKGTFTYAQLEEFAHGQAPFLEKSTWLAGNTQVSHWMKVLDDWKKMLGKSWDHLYAVTNTLYVTRQNNILFTILAQYMGKEAINERLLLIETAEFTTTPEKMLDVLTRIVADRSLGKVFFNDYYLMDVELLSDPSRRAIREEVAKRGMKLLMPTLSPFHSNGWPWRTDPKDGTGPSSLYEIWKVDAK
jgi:hypothetical protein